uniref:Mtf2-like C-terminal domain-containing protein n=1 Tax=Coccidioides posadasii RMSCC 3488 TaxID=454284 RepID=A0A0J6F3K6_COCPO|nr:hypothetical protein CPAG_01050 [Coccidioides posadasii RMSCC 3488]
MRRTIPSKLISASADSTLLPFLYYTRTIITPNRNHRSSSRLWPLAPSQSCPYSTARELSSDGKFNRTSFPTTEACDSSSNVSESTDFPGYLKQRASIVPLRRVKPSPRSTLTATELEIFSRLADNPVDESRPGNTQGDHPRSIPPKQTLEAGSNDPEKAEITSIFNSVVENLNQESPRTIQIANSKKANDEMDSAATSGGKLHDIAPDSAQFSKVYSKLRAFRDSVVDTSTPEGIQHAGIDPYLLAKLIAKRESSKICEELDNAVTNGKGDIGIWQVCEDKIFAMLGMLSQESLASLPGFQDECNQGDGHGQKRSALNNGSEIIGSPKTTIKEASPLNIPDNVPIAPVVLHTYPTVLLHAAKLLHKHYPMSQFSTQLLDTVKAHGRLSFIMGVSASLCNEFISFRWRVYNDLPYVVSVLEEMEEAGIKFNRETLEILDKIRSDRRVDKMRPGSQDDEQGDGTWWWESEATRTSYKDLVGWGRGKVGWITRIRDQVRKEAARKKKMALPIHQM